MSGLEILGIAASIIQIADIGSKLSIKLFTLPRQIKNANQTLHDLSCDVALTCAILRELGESLKEDEQAKLCSDEAVKIAQYILDQCREIPRQAEKIICHVDPAGKSRLRQAADKFWMLLVEQELDSLRGKLGGLKSTMLLLLNVIMFAGQVRNHNTSTLQEQRILIETLLHEKGQKDGKSFQQQSQIQHTFIAKTTEDNSQRLPPKTDKLNEVGQYDVLIKKMLREIDHCKSQLEKSRHSRIRKGVLGIHENEVVRFQVSHGQAVVHRFDNSLLSDENKAIQVPVNLDESGASPKPPQDSPHRAPIRFPQGQMEINLPPPPPPPPPRSSSIESSKQIPWQFNSRRLPPPPPPSDFTGHTTNYFPLHEQPLTSGTYVPNIDTSEFSPVNTPTSSPIESVISWLAENGFSTEWQATFKALNLHGDEFRNIGYNATRREYQGKLDNVIYPQLARECAKTGTTWNPKFERGEGIRLRKLACQLDVHRVKKMVAASSESVLLDAKPASGDSGISLGDSPSVSDEVINKWIFATTDSINYRLINISSFESPDDLRSKICGSSGWQNAQIFLMEPGQTEFEDEIDDKALELLGRKPHSDIPIKVFVRHTAQPPVLKTHGLGIQLPHEPSFSARPEYVLPRKALDEDAIASVSPCIKKYGETGYRREGVLFSDCAPISPYDEKSREPPSHNSPVVSRKPSHPGPDFVNDPVSFLRSARPQEDSDDSSSGIGHLRTSSVTKIPSLDESPSSSTSDDESQIKVENEAKASLSDIQAAADANGNYEATAKRERLDKETKESFLGDKVPTLFSGMTLPDGLEDLVLRWTNLDQDEIQWLGNLSPRQ